MCFFFGEKCKFLKNLLCVFRFLVYKSPEIYIAQSLNVAEKIMSSEDFDFDEISEDYTDKNVKTDSRRKIEELLELKRMRKEIFEDDLFSS